VAEHPRLTSNRRPWLVALSLLLVTGAGIAIAVVIALRHIDHKHAAPPAPPAPPKPFRIVFPEGFTRAQMAQRVTVVARIADQEHRGRVKLNAAGYLAASRRARVPCFGTKVQTNLEGFLFPATYDFLPATTSKQLVAEQLQTFCKRWHNVGMAYARSKNLVPYDVLKIASMIEREAKVPAERRLVSAVVYNRLHARMQLGIDATLRYGLNIPPAKPILRSQLQNPTPYNTRLHQGLPPTPISNPGLATLIAAAHPAKVDYLYYVLKPDHVHDYFTSSASAFYAYECAHGYGC
jgi:uncharacterized YceG family protein